MTRPFRSLFVLLGCLLLAPVVRAEEEEEDEAGSGAIVVTARRLPTEVERSGLSLTRIEAGDLEARQTTSLADAFREVPGVWVVRGGGHGGLTSLFLRGAASNQTKVLLDGFALNDPTLGGQFNAYDLLAGGLGRVEVLRGSQSTLYGSEAIGGVVQMVSRDDRGPGTIRLLAEAGAQRTRRFEVEAGGGTDELSGGIVATTFGTENEVDRNDFEAQSAAARLRYRPVEELEISFTGRLIESRAEEPYDFGNPLPDDANIERDRTTTLLGVRTAWEATDGVTIRAQVSRLEIESDFTNGPDTDGASAELSSDSTARVTNGLLSVAVEGLRLLGVDGEIARDRFLIGVEVESAYSRNRTSSPFGATRVEDTVRDRALFLQEELTLFDRVDATAGIRWTDNDFFGNEASPSANLQYRHLETDTTVAGSYTIGYRAPTPIEFADAFVGNPDLEEERSRSWDVGIRQSLLDGALAIGATWFELEVRDLIAYDPETFRLENFRETRTRGLELNARWAIDDAWAVGGSWTRQDPLDLDAESGEEDQLPNRAEEFGSVWVRYENAGLSVLLRGLFSDAYPSTGIEGPDQSTRRRPGAKTWLALGASYELTDRIRVFGRAENLLDDEIVELETGPKSGGLGVFLGAEITFR